MAGEATDVQLVDDHLLTRQPEGRIALPVVFLGEHDGARGVMRLHSLALATPAIPAGEVHRACPGIDQLDAGIEAPTVAMRIIRPFHPPGVMGA
jgi:hypothetical protein